MEEEKNNNVDSYRGINFNKKDKELVLNNSGVLIAKKSKSFSTIKVICIVVLLVMIYAIVNSFIIDLLQKLEGGSRTNKLIIVSLLLILSIIILYFLALDNLNLIIDIFGISGF